MELLAQAISLKVQLACHGTPWLLHPPLKQKTSNRWSSSELVLTDARRFRKPGQEPPAEGEPKLAHSSLLLSHLLRSGVAC